MLNQAPRLVLLVPDFFSGKSESVSLSSVIGNNGDSEDIDLVLVTSVCIYGYIMIMLVKYLFILLLNTDTDVHKATMEKSHQKVQKQRASIFILSG